MRTRLLSLFGCVLLSACNPDPADGGSTALACPDGLDMSGGTLAGNDADQAALPEITLSASERLAQDIIGNWVTDRYTGECLNYAKFLHVAPGGSLDSILVENDRCYPERRGTLISSGSYSLEGRTLLLQPAGSMQQFDVALWRTGTPRRLRHSLFVPYDERTWRLTSAHADSNPEGLLVAQYHTTVDLAFDAPVPSVGTGDCSVTIRYAIDVYVPLNSWGQELPPAEREHYFSGELPTGSCHFQPGIYGQQLDIGQFALEGHPGGSWVYTELQSALGAAQLWRDPCEPDYMFVLENSFAAIEAVPESL